MPVTTLTLSWKQKILGNRETYESHHSKKPSAHLPIKLGSWVIEICETGSRNSTDWQFYKFQRMEVPKVTDAVKWLLTAEQYDCLSTRATMKGTAKWNSPPMEHITQYLDIMEAKDYQIVGSTSTFLGEENGPIWVWTLRV